MEELRRHRAGTVAMLAAASVGFLAFQSAAVAADNTAAANEALEEVVITGSSIAQRADTTPLPVTILTSKDIAKTGLTSASDLIQKLPAMQGFVGQTNSVNGAGAGQTTAALHSLPSKYTVVLLDGQRIAGYSLNNGLGGGSAVNLESIPLEAIERVEVLTDGASALYGADAVAGVVNFITKKNTTDGNFFYHASVPDQHNGGAWSAGITKGFGDLKSDGYNLLFSYTHDVQNVLNASDRDVSRRGGFFKFNSGGTTYVFNTRTSNTEPGNIIIGAIGASYNPYYNLNGNCGNPNADVLVSDPLNTTCRFNYAATVEDVPPYVRDSGLLRGTFQVNDNSQFWFEAIVSQFDLTARYAAPAQPLGLSPTRLPALWNTYVVPYLSANGYTYPGDLGNGLSDCGGAAPQPACDVSSATLGYRAVSAGGRTDDWGYATRHIAVGFDTKLAGWDLHINAVASHGQFTDTAAGGYLDYDQFATAVATGAYDPVLGTGQSALKATILHDPFSTTYTDLNTIGANAQHKMFDLTGGPSIISIGAEYVTTRTKTDYSDLLQAGNGTVDQPNTTDAVLGGGGGAVNFEGDRKHEGIYAEATLPFLDNLNTIASVRYDSYDKVHSTTIYDTSVPNAQGLYDRLPSGDLGNSFSNATYKLSARWTPIEKLAFRASIGTGFKVPEITDIAGTLSFNGSTAGSYACPIPGAPGCLPGNAQYDLVAGPNGASGANGLKPEKSTQYTFGVRVDPVKGLFFSADYWNVHVKDQIQSAGISEQLAYGNPSQYSYLFISPYTDPVGQFTTIALKQVPFNGGEANYSGIDFNFGYSTDAGSWGTFNAGLSGTYMLTQDYTYTDGGAKNTDLGIFGPDNTVVFKTVMQASVGLTTGKWANTLSMHYKSGYTDIAHVGDGAVFADDPSSPTAFGAAVDFCCLSVPAYYTFDWQTSYDIAKAVNLTVGIKNLADKDPPLSLQNAGGGNQAGYDGRYADPLGRTYYLRANYKF
ncbi:MAG: TonB-dependent receptor [Proteobacteria bacterium]|nr:TonB-dependent receptor [Pseudomonadota bacterium]